MSHQWFSILSRSDLIQFNITDSMLTQFLLPGFPMVHRQQITMVRNRILEEHEYGVLGFDRARRRIYGFNFRIEPRENNLGFKQSFRDGWLQFTEDRQLQPGDIILFQWSSTYVRLDVIVLTNDGSLRSPFRPNAINNNKVMTSKKDCRMGKNFNSGGTSSVPVIVTGGGDITQQKDVRRALKGADCIFHVASYGMSGKEMLQFDRVYKANINGTCLILDVCVDLEVKRPVYVSTANAVIGGKEIINGDGTLHYLPLDDHVDSYGCSKSIAEQLVLKYNGCPFRETNSGCLYTCSICAAAVYGSGEERHLPRVVNNAKLGLLLFTVGDPIVRIYWIYVDNCVFALLLASMGLIADIPVREGCPVAVGQAYFISDGCPFNSFEFLCPLLKSLHYDLPNTSLSLPSALMLEKMFCAVNIFLFPWLSKSWLPYPMYLPTEVYKVGVTHYFSYLKAKEELGYYPMVSHKEGMKATIVYWKDKKKRSLDGPTIYVWLFCMLRMSALIGVALFPDFGPLSPVTALALFLYGSMRTIRIISVLAVGAHVAESIYAWNLAKKVDPDNARGWFWQTLALGIFSLRFLLKRALSSS